MWSIPEAQAEARRLQILIDQGYDPREVKAQNEATREAELAAQKLKEKRESITLGTAWIEYIEERKLLWSDRHYKDYITLMHSGSEALRRGNGLTVPGELA